jgi:hypothetical protein
VTVLGRGGPHAAGVWIMSRVVAVTACGFMLAACSATMPSLSLDFMKPALQAIARGPDSRDVLDPR